MGDVITSHVERWIGIAQGTEQLYRDMLYRNRDLLLTVYLKGMFLEISDISFKKDSEAPN